MRQVGNRHQQRRPLLLHLIDLNFELPDVQRPRLVGGKNVGRVLPLAFGARDLVARGILLALQPFHLGNQAPPACFKRGDLLELRVRLQPSTAQAGANVFDVITHEASIEHR